MPTMITLVKFTDQGIRNVKDSPERMEAFRALVEAQGGTVKSAYWTLGSYDMVITVEGGDRGSRNDYEPEGWFAR